MSNDNAPSAENDAPPNNLLSEEDGPLAKKDAPAPDAEHLRGLDCGWCGHAALAHYRNPSCRSCRCNADPLCWCGALASKHVIPPGSSTR